MRKILSLVLVVAIVATVCAVFAGCSSSSKTTYDFRDGNEDALVVGLITLHDSSSTYDKNFIDAAIEVAKAEKIKLIVKSNVEEGNGCYESAVEMVEDGCNIVFADSFGHESYMLKAAKEFPNVQFCHATGTSAHTAKVANFHNAFASIYEGRYLAGIAAGMKLNAMITAGTITAAQAKIGYVAAFPYAEVISGYTSFFLGARSVCESATMEVTYTNSWYDPTAEKSGAELLISKGCKLISQHADSMGAPSACEEAGVPDVTYNISTKDACPNTYLVGSKIDWSVYFKHMIDETASKGKDWVEYDWVGTIANGAVKLTEINTGAVADGTQAAIEAAKAQMVAGTLKVFDTSKFTVNSAKVTTYLADVDDDGTFTGETEAIVTVGTVSYFAESQFRSAPYFDMIIDGITVPKAN